MQPAKLFMCCRPEGGGLSYYTDHACTLSLQTKISASRGTNNIDRLGGIDMSCWIKTNFLSHWWEDIKYNTQKEYCLALNPVEALFSSGFNIFFFQCCNRLKWKRRHIWYKKLWSKSLISLMAFIDDPDKYQ